MTLIVIFAASASLKITPRGRKAFNTTVHRLPGFLSKGGALTYVLPVVEIVMAAVLLPGELLVSRVSALALVAGFAAIMTFFALYITIRRLDIPCRCFGVRSEAPIGWLHVIRNALMFAAALSAWEIARRGLDGSLSSSTYLVCSLPAACLGIIVISLDDIRGVWPAKP